MKLNARLGPNAVVKNGSIIIDVTTPYGVLQVPVRGFRIEDVDDAGLFENIVVEIHLPDWIVK